MDLLNIYLTLRQQKVCYDPLSVPDKIKSYPLVGKKKQGQREKGIRAETHKRKVKEKSSVWQGRHY